MKKIIITLAALSALSAGAFAANDDRADAYPFMTNSTVSSEGLTITFGEVDADKYVNPRQLR